MIQDIAKQDKAVILIEPNGDLSEQIARQQTLDKERLVYIDCSLAGFSPCINPFDLINLDNELDIEKQSQVIRNALIQIFAWIGQPITLQMQSLLQPCLEIVAKERGTLLDLQRFMVDGLNEDLLEAGKQSPKHGEFFMYKFNESSLAISRQGIYQKLMNLLNFSVFSDFFCGKTTIDIKQAIDEKKVILFNLSKGKLGEYSSSYIGMMMVAIIQNLIFHRANIPVEQRVPLRIYIDEFQDFVSESSEQIFVQGRKYHVGLAVASQIVGQKMTAEMTKIVLGNTDVKFIGVNGYQSLSVMSRETYTEIEELNKLSVGRFFCKIFTGQSFVLEVPKDHLDTSTCVGVTQWEELFQEQLSKFYAKRYSLVAKPAATSFNTSGFRALSIQDEVFIPKY